MLPTAEHLGFLSTELFTLSKTMKEVRVHCWPENLSRTVPKMSCTDSRRIRWIHSLHHSQCLQDMFSTTREDTQGKTQKYVYRSFQLRWYTHTKASNY